MRIRAALILACATALVSTTAAAAAPAPALFQVGAAKASIAPALAGVPVYAGGFGASPPITRESDPTRSPVEVRAFYVANGQKAVAIAVVDAQAYFAAYQ